MESSQPDVVPINGKSTFCFTLASLAFVSLSDWPPPGSSPHEWKAGLTEFERHLKIVNVVTIWSPWPILSFCVGGVQAPIPDELLTPAQRKRKQVLAELNGGSPDGLEVRFFFFPTAEPEYQSQAVAQLCCDTTVGASEGKVKMWVDALGEDELSEENRSDIASAVKKYR